LLNRSARVLVPCSWNRSVFESSGVRPGLDVVPHACSEEELSQASSLAGVRPSDFVFYCIGTWITRKAMTRTIRSYLSTFSRKDPVILVVKTSAQHLSSRLLRRLRVDTRRIVRILQARYRRPARVLLLTDLMSDEDMLGLHARGDCFLSLSRGEGWNLGAFDAASFGRPVIATGMGGPIDFLGGDYPYLVDYRLVQVNDPSGRSSYSPDQLWAEADVEHAHQLMREVFHNRQAAEEVAKRTRSSIRSRFSQASIGKQLLRSVELALEG